MSRTRTNNNGSRTTCQRNFSMEKFRKQKLCDWAIISLSALIRRLSANIRFILRTQSSKSHINSFRAASNDWRKFWCGHDSVCERLKREREPDGRTWTSPLATIHCGNLSGAPTFENSSTETFINIVGAFAVKENALYTVLREGFGRRASGEMLWLGAKEWAPPYFLISNRKIKRELFDWKSPLMFISSAGLKSNAREESAF